MILSIITINRNNAVGLEKTMSSVFSQTHIGFEYIVVDGASTDGSFEVIKRYATLFGSRLKWISEPDKGIYNAMNKGIKMASGEFVQFLNSGDCLASDDVTDRMLDALNNHETPSILYGNMLKCSHNDGIVRDRCFAGKDISFLGFYIGSLNHPSAYIRKCLFDKYGMYDEGLKIVSDWKWFLQAIILGEEKPVYTDIDVSIFDMTGISVTNWALNDAERKSVLKELIPAPILADYARWSSPINRLRRLERHPWANRIVWFLERTLFKIEKRRNRNRREYEF